VTLMGKRLQPARFRNLYDGLWRLYGGGFGVYLGPNATDTFCVAYYAIVI